LACLSYNYVTPVKLQDGREDVLKRGVPGKEIHTEIAALGEYAGIYSTPNIFL